MIKYLLRIILATLTFVEQDGKNLKHLLYLTLKDVCCKYICADDNTDKEKERTK